MKNDGSALIVKLVSENIMQCISTRYMCLLTACTVLMRVSLHTTHGMRYYPTYTNTYRRNIPEKTPVMTPSRVNLPNNAEVCLNTI
jgi:hypothetical protein